MTDHSCSPSCRDLGLGALDRQAPGLQGPQVQTWCSCSSASSRGLGNTSFQATSALFSAPVP